MTFIEANPDLDITVADIAHAAHVSVRAVQVAFRRHLGTTPMAYLRRVRLDAARAQLLNATPGQGITVTAVASQWGWARPSRFAADFRAAYGQHPAPATLTRRRRFLGRKPSFYRLATATPPRAL